MKATLTLLTLLLTPANCDVLDDATAPASNRRLLRRDSTGKGRGKNDKSDVLDVGFGWWREESDAGGESSDVKGKGDDKRGWGQDAVTVVPGKGWTDKPGKPDGGKPEVTPGRPGKGDDNDNDKPSRPGKGDDNDNDNDKPSRPGWPWRPDKPDGKGDGGDKPGRPGWPGKPEPSPEPSPDPDDDKRPFPGMGNGGGGGKWPLPGTPDDDKRPFPGLGNGGGGGKWPLPGTPGKRPFKLVAYVSLLMNKWKAKRATEGGEPSAQKAEAETEALKKTEVLKKTSGSVAKAFGERLKREDASIDAESLEIGLEQVSTFTLQCAPGLHSDEALLRYATIAACRGRRLCRVSRGNSTGADARPDPATMPSDVPPTLTEGGFGKRRRLSTAAFTFVVVLTLGANETLDAPLQLEVAALASSSLTVSAAPAVVEVRFTVAMADASAWHPANSSTAMSSEDLAAAFGSSVGSTGVLSGALGVEVGQDAIVVIPTLVVTPAAPATPGAAPPPPAAEEPHRRDGHKEEDQGSAVDIAMVAGAAVAGVLCLALLVFAAVLVRSRSRRGDADADRAGPYSAGSVKTEKPTAAQKEGSFERNGSLSSDKV